MSAHSMSMKMLSIGLYLSLNEFPLTYIDSPNADLRECRIGRIRISSYTFCRILMRGFLRAR